MPRTYQKGLVRIAFSAERFNTWDGHQILAFIFSMIGKNIVNGIFYFIYYLRILHITYEIEVSCWRAGAEVWSDPIQPGSKLRAPSNVFTRRASCHRAGPADRKNHTCKTLNARGPCRRPRHRFVQCHAKAPSRPPGAHANCPRMPRRQAGEKPPGRRSQCPDHRNRSDLALVNAKGQAVTFADSIEPWSAERPLRSQCPATTPGG